MAATSDPNPAGAPAPVTVTAPGNFSSAAGSRQVASPPQAGASGTVSTSGSRLPARLVTVMAVASGAVVANLYYAQPLLHQIGRTFHAGPTATSLVVTVTQLGYAAGLLLLVPLGDLRPRRSLVRTVFVLAAGSLVVCAVAPTLWLFEVAALATGTLSVSAQVLVPFAADLAEPERRGRVVARIMTGLLVGILVARTVSGLLATLAGWRTIYWVSAGLMLLLAGLLRVVLPSEPARPQVRYRRLVRSSLALLATEPVLRRRAWHGAVGFGAFSVLWTTLAFLLAAPPFRYSSAVIGLFGLAGVAGVGAANLAGKMADSSRTALSTVVAGSALTCSFGLLALGHQELAPLVAGIVVLDIGTQGLQITNQALVYELRPDARSRINSAYMLCYFAGGAVGSVTAGTVYAATGWYGVCLLGAGFGALSLAMAALERARPAPRR